MNIFSSVYRNIQQTKFGFAFVYAMSRLFTAISILLYKRTAPLPYFSTLRDVELALERLQWNEDAIHFSKFKIRHFWMRQAEEVQWYLDNNLLPQTDCDEYATYAAKALQQVEEANNPRVLTVRWLAPNGSLGGHNVAIYSYPIQNGMRMYGHIGNWGHYRGYNSIARIVDDIAKGGQGVAVAYALASPELKLLTYERI